MELRNAPTPNPSNRQTATPTRVMPGGTPKAPPAPSLTGDRLSATPVILPLGGHLNRVPMLNANHPEIVRGPGISVSTMPFEGPGHLQKAFQGPFELFVHHNNQSGRDLYQTVVLHNPGTKPITVKVGPSASHTTNTAGYRERGPMAVLDPTGRFVSGPGDATASAILRNERAIAAPHLLLAPGEFKVLHTQRFSNGKEVTSQYRLESDAPGNSLGTGDVQVASLDLRYPDAAYKAHGNYGVEYRIQVPLANAGKDPREVSLYFDSPGKPDKLSRAFRGTVAVDLTDAQGHVTTTYVHVSQRRGERGEKPLATLTVPPGDVRSARVRFVYPANATPPHALRLQG